MPERAGSPDQPGVLFVDDEVNILKSLARLFRAEPVRVFTASSAAEALALVAAERISVVVSDQRMPGTTGVRLLAQVRERSPEVVRILLTGHTEIGIAIEAINQGEIFRLLTKPWNDDELRATVRQALADCAIRAEVARLNQLLQAQNASLSEMNQSLERKVAERTHELEAKNRELRTAYLSTVRSCKREFIERIYLAGLLHDIGKIGVPDAIIGKPERLTSAEYELMKRHPEIGARILEPVKFLADIVPCVRHHHEWYDGSPLGYPERLTGGDIPYPSRIILVADTVEAMTSDRPYRRALPLARVVEEIERFRGTQFDPSAADAFLRIAEREEEDFLETASKFDIEDFVAEPEERR